MIIDVYECRKIESWKPDPFASDCAPPKITRWILVPHNTEVPKACIPHGFMLSSKAIKTSVNLDRDGKPLVGINYENINDPNHVERILKNI